MGCTSEREKIESKMLLLKLQRVEIQKEKEKNCEEFQKKTGATISRDPIPDYIDHEALEIPQDSNGKKNKTEDEDEADEEEEDEANEEEEEEEGDEEEEEEEGDEEEEKEEEEKEVKPPKKKKK